jgi:hypothetical protein
MNTDAIGGKWYLIVSLAFYFVVGLCKRRMQWQ